MKKWLVAGGVSVVLPFLGLLVTAVLIVGMMGSGSVSVSSSSSGSSSGTGCGSAVAGSGAEGLLSQPIGSNLGISDGQAEAWAMENMGYAVGHFALTASNIRQVTQAVRQAGVSPAFFYAYAKNENGGAGGFINHYAADMAGGAVSNATRDAGYLVQQSKDMTARPATGGGEPESMPTTVTTGVLNSLASGTIGRAYIPATSAVTAEIETGADHWGAWSGLYGTPLADMEASIKAMGSTLDFATATTACAPGAGTVGAAASEYSQQYKLGSTDPVIDKYIQWGVNEGQDDTHGYSQGQGGPTVNSGAGRTNTPDVDCSSFVFYALQAAGFPLSGYPFDTHSMGGVLQTLGFENIISQVDVQTGDGLQAGDILVNTAKHTEIYAGSGADVGAHSNKPGYTAGDSGDDPELSPAQRDGEVSPSSYWDDGWNQVWRYKGGE